MPVIRSAKQDYTLRKHDFEEHLVAARKEAKPERLQCVLCLLWLFGKRIVEVVSLERKDIWFDEGYMWVRFKVFKKKKDRAPYYQKRIFEGNDYVQKYIKPYWEGVKDGFLFPSYGGGYRQAAKWNKLASKNGDAKVEVMKEYKYGGGYITPARVRQLLKKIDPELYPHLYRHSLATRMAEKNVSVPKLMAWFDWSTAQVAMDYVQKSPQMTEDLSNKEW